MQENRRSEGPARSARTRYVFAGTREPEREGTTKVCPQCGELLFADMDVCYGCLYEFPRRGQQPPSAAHGLSLVGPAATNRIHAGGEGSRAADPLEGIDLDEIDDELDDMMTSHTEADLTAQPRHRKPRADAAEATMDLAALESATAPEPEPAMPHPQRFRILARSVDMHVHIPLSERGLSIGRGEANDIVLCSRAVSRTHLRLVPLQDKVLVEDCGATNPATIEGRRLEGSASLGVGGMVVVCGTEFEVEDDLPDPAA